jgi:RimJ/RimL family protein N-acetyltransferase
MHSVGKILAMVKDEYLLETDRLILERFTLRHAAFILELVNSPGWLQNIGDRGIRDLEAAKRYIQEGPMTAYAQYGYGFSAVSLKEDRTPIGGCGLIRRAGLDFPDIGFALLPGYMGMGYAHEIAAATLAHAKHELGLSKIQGITLPTNKPSIRLLERIGLTFEKMMRLPGDEEPLMLFQIELDKW